MTKPAPHRHYESATEEFERRVRELYALADKMGRRITILVKKKSASDSHGIAEPQGTRTEAQSHREPGEN